MSHPVPRPADTWSPLYFLASLGAGGLAVTFFMYLMFWVPHPGQPVPVFEDLARAVSAGSVLEQSLICLSMAAIATFGFLNIRYLVWNLRSFLRFRETEAYAKLRASNGETALLAMPLALAMSVNVGFIFGLVFVPGLWSVVEYLFPLAMVAFGLIGWLALSQIGHFLGRVLSQGGLFDVTAHNSFAQLLPAFALSMVAVGFAAPAALSGTPLTVSAGLMISTAFGTAALVYTAVAAITAFNSMLHYGTAKEAAPTLMVVVPIMTVLGIMALRQTHGLHTTFEVHTAPAETLMFLTRLLTVQLLFAALGLLVLRRQGYFTDFIWGTKTSPGSYALVCPGVALNVMLHFWLNKGLVESGLVAKFGAAYWSVSALAVVLQIAMIALVVTLNRRHFGRAPEPKAIPAE
jgi:hypothetical protein